MHRTIFAFGLCVAVAACGCKSTVVGEDCEVPGVMNDDVAQHYDAEECDGGTCLYYQDDAGIYGSFCTASCVADGDCPHGMVCATIDTDPTPSGERLESLCIPEEPVEPFGDDDDYTPSGSPPELANLELFHELSGADCIVRVEFDWHDEDADLNGADAYITFIEVDDLTNEIEFEGNVEHKDAVDIHLMFTIPVDGTTIQFSTRYHVYVTMEDVAGNESNQLSYSGYTTPDASCQ